MEREIDALKEGSGVAEIILESIEFVAINEGYSIIYDAEDTNILWYHKQVDLTDKVIEHLRALARRE